MQPDMSSNISSSNLSLHSPNSSSPPNYMCVEITVGSHLFAVMTGSYLLIFLPLSVFILQLGLQRWRAASAAATTNSLDVFTYNTIAMELIGVLGCCFYCGGIYGHVQKIQMLGIHILSTITAGQMFFHVLTCAERYLAVIHPIRYMGLKKGGGARFRNISIVLVWFLFIAWGVFTVLYSQGVPAVPTAILLTSSFIVTSFFSLSVLCALISPGPGEGGGDREGADQLKRRAFQTIVAITGALTLRFGGQLLSNLLDAAAALSYRARCVVMLSMIWTSVPSSYVLPLLFLHRAAKLPCFKYDSESGRGSEEARTNE
ncbi:hypothetical protein F2P81_018098 [Scophthalmus maximus]|uniref:G-protein coupled receptors family 1 profile domain-containing protein n=1 Tax=Scophthalmus maximus TaxID=52904 RepID=A0A6A4S3Q7_SCOMX|nr:hypothetical protein F2P81_018098 [Scophthalmus maximus]